MFSTTRLVGFGLPVMIGLSVAVSTLACRPLNRDLPRSAAEPAADSPRVRDVRILLSGRALEVKLKCAGPVSVESERGVPLFDKAISETVHLRSDAERGLWAGGQHFEAMNFVRLHGPDELEVEWFDGEKWSEPAAYPGSIHLIRGDDGLLSVINRVDVERYVTAVVGVEAWPTFADEALQVQAIVARTYVLYQMQESRSADFDLGASQSAQVYRGLKADGTDGRARRATEKTRGVVSTWSDRGEERLFCTYYAAACGGMSQSAAIFGPQGAIGPLAGGVACDDCKIAPKDNYRWGPTKISIRDLMNRLQARYPEAQSLGGLANITPVEQTADGRATRLRLHGSSGGVLDIQAERFRLAVGPTVMRSAACDIRLTPSEVIFENGRGFGHGLGLCQWGAEGKARRGMPAADILRHYYPGSKLTRVY